MARPKDTDAATQHVLVELERRGLLLQAGHEFASVAELVVGEPIRGSWWAHPDANLIYWVCQDLDAHADVAEARLLAGKVTQVWRTVWADVAAVALAGEPWQLAGLGRAELTLIERAQVNDVRVDTVPWSGDRKLGDVCRLLERRLLVKGHDVHSDAGRHVKVLGSWRRWWDAVGRNPLPTAAAARAHLETLVGDPRLLPWTAPKGATTKRRRASSG